MHDELGRMLKEAIVAYLKVSSLHLIGETGENQENHNQDSQCPGRDSSQPPSEYKSDVLAPEPTFPVQF
jgi:hypothetical protein